MMTASSGRAEAAALLATFFVQGAHYALDAAKVQEVIRFGAATPVRHAPEAVLGVINLRGRIVTVVDVGLRLRFPRVPPGPDCRVFIVEDRNEFVGLLVDRVGEVLEVDGASLEPPPANVSQTHSNLFKGVYRAGGKVVTLVDLEALLAESAL
jgi:purine-binding chemotaxis protein CheW